MGQLSDRLGELLREYGWDPAAWSSDLHALAALERTDPKAAQERFHELRFAFAAQRRADLLRQLRAFPFLRDVPPAESRGLGLREVESEVRVALRALRHARRAAEALDEGRALAATLRLRQAPPEPALQAARWEDAEAVEEAAQAWRRAVAREARVEARAREARRDAARLRHHRMDLPDLSSGALPDAAQVDAALEPLEARVALLAALEEAHDDALAPLRAPEVRAWRADTGRRLQREAKALLQAQDAAGLRALRVRAEALRQEAAQVASQAARARRSGHAPPPAERRAGDPMDPYA